jgi:hypothetical protein
MGIQHDIINQTGEVNNSNNKRTTKTTKTTKTTRTRTRTTTTTKTTNNNNNTHNNTHNHNHNHKNKENNNKNKAAWERMGHSHHFGLVCHLQPHVFFKSHGNPIVVGSRFTVSRSFKMLVTSSLLSRSLTTNKSHSRSCGDWWRKRRPQRKDWHGKSMKMTCGLHHGSMDTIYQ